MTREELDRLLEAARGDSANVELAASKITASLNLVEGSELTAQELKGAAIELVWIATSSDWIRAMLIHAIIGQPKRRRGNPGKPDKREDAILIDAYREHFGDTPVSVRRLARHIGVSRPTISGWRKDPSYQKEVSEAARDYKDSIKVIGIRPKATYIGIRPKATYIGFRPTRTNVE